MVRQVLSFARGVEGERVALQPKHLIKEIVKILRETLPKSIEISFQIPQDLWIISADATQIHQVLMNLCVNARDAMPEGGSIAIKAENVFVDENYARMHLEAKPGRFVMIGVADTGPGMSPEIQSRIFEPFFTTKEMTKGTGLGLSTALTIVKSHGGFINVYSELHKGSQFTLYFPAVDTQGAADSLALQTDLLLGNGELILVVDDYEDAREMYAEYLQYSGFRVAEARNGLEAMEKAFELRPDLILMDLSLPVMDGWEATRRLKADGRTKSIPVVALTGHARAGHSEGARKAGCDAFVTKPCLPDALVLEVRRVLEQSRTVGRSKARS
jgi:hypothetical protein